MCVECICHNRLAVSRSTNARAFRLAACILVVSLVLVYAGDFVLGLAATVSAALIRMLEFIGAVGIPVAGGVVLAWFTYKLLLDPVLRQRRLNRIREHRARRDSWKREDEI